VQAGPVKRRGTFREIFASAAAMFLFVLIVLEPEPHSDGLKSYTEEA